MKRQLFTIPALLTLATVLAPQTRAQVTPGQIAISEYVEGSGTNKIIELFNFSDTSIDLGAQDCEIETYSNGGTTIQNSADLSGSISSRDTYVVANQGSDSESNADTGDDADQTFGFSFNGDDAVVFQCGGTVLDVIGQVGFDPGSQWSENGVSTADNTIRRQTDACDGDTDTSDAFDPSVDYDEFPQDTFDGLNAHTTTCPIVAGPAVGVATSATPGWRQLGAPGLGLDVDDLAQINLVSGAGGYTTGTDCAVGDVTNLFTSYSSANATNAFGGYTPAADGQAFERGRGFFWYFFGDSPATGFPSSCSDGTNPSTTQALPITLPEPAMAAIGDATVTFSDASDAEGFYLIANPFGSAFDLSGVSASGATSTNAVALQDAFQTWDPEIGAYVTITTDGAGDLTDADTDDVSIWQGIWAERTGADPAEDVDITFDFDGALSGNDGDEFYARRALAERQVALEVTNGSVTGAAALVRFVEGAGNGWDRSDLSKIGSLNPNWVQIGPVGVGRDGDVVTKAIESRSADLSGTVQIPLSFTTTEPAGEFTLSWPTLALGDGWTATLTDEVTGTTVELSAVGSYIFAYAPGDDAERFTLAVTAASTDGETGPALAEVGAVYPNPTAGSARLAVTVVEAQPVTVEVFDAVGRRVAVPFEGQMVPGAQRTVDLATYTLAPGVYVVRVQGASFTESRRLVVTR